MLLIGSTKTCSLMRWWACMFLWLTQLLLHGCKVNSNRTCINNYMTNIWTSSQIVIRIRTKKLKKATLHWFTLQLCYLNSGQQQWLPKHVPNLLLPKTTVCRDGWSAIAEMKEGFSTEKRINNARQRETHCYKTMLNVESWEYYCGLSVRLADLCQTQQPPRLVMSCFSWATTDNMCLLLKPETRASFNCISVIWYHWITGLTVILKLYGSTKTEHSDHYSINYALAILAHKHG